MRPGIIPEIVVFSTCAPSEWCHVIPECSHTPFTQQLRSGLLLSDYMHYYRNPNPGVAESRFKLTPAPDMAEVERVLGPGFALPWSEVLRTAMDGCVSLSACQCLSVQIQANP